MGLHNLDRNEYQTIIKTGLILTCAGSLFMNDSFQYIMTMQTGRKRKEREKTQREKKARPYNG